MAQALNNRAMLVDTTVRRWWPVKVDKRISDEVAVKHNSDPRLGRFHKRLVAKKAMAELTAARNEIRTAHFAMTLPWQDDGLRILSSDGYFKYVEKIGRLKTAYEALAAHYSMFQYPKDVADAKRDLNGLFNPDDYPADIHDQFGVTIQILPMPNANDFRVEGLDEKAVAEIKAQIERDTQATIKRAMTSVWERLRDVLEKAVEGLRAYERDAEGKVSRTFRDSLIRNITAQLEVIPLINITKDPELDRFADLIRRHVTEYDAEQLRVSDVTRDAVATKAEKILDKMKSFLIQ